MRANLSNLVKQVTDRVRYLKSSNLPFIGLEHIGKGTLHLESIGSSSEVSSEKTLFSEGDILFGTLRPYFRKVIRAKFRGISSTDITVLRTKNGNLLDQDYLFYLIANPDFINSVSVFAKDQRPRIKWKSAADYDVDLPQIDTQKRIASILSAYDDLIEVNLKRIKLLEEAADLIYKEWFVNFRFPGYENTKFVDGLPEGWEKTTLTEVANLVTGQSPESKYYNTDELGNPFHQGVATFGDRYVAHSVYSTSGTKIAEEGDLLFSVRAPVGRINLTDRKIIIGRGLCSIRHRKNHQLYLFHQLRNLFFKEDLIGSGAIYNAVKKKDLASFEVTQPADSITHLYEDFISPFESQIKNLTLQVELLRQARDLLLPKLISGEIEV